MIAPDVLAELLDALAERIAIRLAAGRECDAYSSTDLPPRCSRRRFAELCRSGRVVDARQEGRAWVCSRQTWEAARVRRPAPARRSVTTQAQADALLARAGLRVVRGSR